MRRSSNWLASGLLLVVASPAWAAGTGTGFVINQDGYIVTNNHVVTERFEDQRGNIYERVCNRLHVKSTAIRGHARLVGRDQANDLAVIKVDTAGAVAQAPRHRQRVAQPQNRRFEGGMRSLGDELADRSQPVSALKEPSPMRQAERATPMRSSGRALPLAARPVRPGQQINLFGFPRGVTVSTQMKVTQGIVVSTMGPQNNSSLIQIDAASNPGNSGGPILDSSGNVVAVLVGGIPEYEGFNFGINVTVAKQLMDSLGVTYATNPSNSPTTTEDQYRNVRPYVVLITCY